MSIMILAADTPVGTQGWHLGRGWKADRERAGGGERKGSPGGGDSTGKRPGGAGHVQKRRQSSRNLEKRVWHVGDGERWGSWGTGSPVPSKEGDFLNLSLG